MRHISSPSRILGMPGKQADGVIDSHTVTVKMLVICGSDSDTSPRIMSHGNI